MFRLPKFPYNPSEFRGFLSEEAFECHAKKHQQADIDSLNRLIKGTPREHLSLEEIIRVSSWGDSRLFNHAAQAWNHTFYGYSLSPTEKKPRGALLNKLNARFGSLERFEEDWVAKGMARFGSGWIWLVLENESLETVTTSNAETPILFNQVPLVCTDLWEHAYYVDYRHDRESFLRGWLRHIDWDFAAQNLIQPAPPKMGARMLN
jgi:Fe-Mn family superoxide dismutase